MSKKLKHFDYSIPADPPYPGTLLREGIRGSEVSRMQAYLNSIATEYALQISKLSVDGMFGSNTKKTVCEFQTLTALDADGIVGQLTWNNIVVVYNSIAGGGEYIWPGITLRPGFTGSDIKFIQSKLNAIGKIYTAIAQLTVDGIYGTNTADSVRLFQAQFGLEADGLSGRATWDSIYRVYSSVLNMQYPDVSPQFPKTAIQLESSGDCVRFIQSYLNRIRTVRGTEWPLLNVDGIFGNLTYAAVTAFQAKFNLNINGVVDQETWTELKSRFNSSF